jgi:hypothetical protein
MKKLVLICVVLLFGCAGNPPTDRWADNLHYARWKERAPALVGCPPEETIIEDFKHTYIPKTTSFKVTCRGKVFYCTDLKPYCKEQIKK